METPTESRLVWKSARAKQQLCIMERGESKISLRKLADNTRRTIECSLFFYFRTTRDPDATLVANAPPVPVPFGRSGPISTFGQVIPPGAKGCVANSDSWV